MSRGAAVGRVTAGFFNDRIGRVNAVILLEMITVVVVVIFGLFTNIKSLQTTFYIMATLWGFSAVAILSMRAVLVGL